MPRGRPPKVTPETTEEVCQLIETGIPIETAAQAKGVGVSTWHRWTQRGREAKRGPYRRFYKRVMEARARAEVRFVAIIALSAEKDWRSAAWMLERRNPKQWGQQSRVVVTGDPKQPVELIAVTSEQVNDNLIRRLEETRERFIAAGEVTVLLAR